MSPRAPIQELGGGGERGKERERERRERKGEGEREGWRRRNDDYVTIMEARSSTELKSKQVRQDCGPLWNSMENLFPLFSFRKPLTFPDSSVSSSTFRATSCTESSWHF